MTRPLRVLVVAAAAAAAALIPRAGAQAPTSTTAVRFNMARLGARAGGNDAAMKASSDALRAALAISIPGHVKDLYWPGARDDYYLDGPVWIDQGNVWFTGDGPTNSVIRTQRSDPAVIIGIQRTPMGVGLTASHGYDLFGRLDTTAAGAPGVRTGLRTYADSHLAQMAGPFSDGPAPAADNTLPGHYGDVRRGTIDLALDYTDAPADTGSIWCVSGTIEVFGDSDPASWWLRLWTRTGEGAAPINNDFKFTVGTERRVKRVSIQFDLDARSVVAYADRVQVAVVGSFSTPVGTAFTLNPTLVRPALWATSGTFLTANDFYGDGRGRDRAFAGHRMSATNLYAANGVGTAQARIDGLPVNDLNQFFRQDSTTFATLPLTDSPAKIPGRLVAVTAGPPAWFSGSSALFLSVQNSNEFNTPGNVRFRGMGIRNGLTGGTQQPYGYGVAVASALTLTFEECAIAGGAFGIGGLNATASYPIRVRRCNLSGKDSAYYGFYSIGFLQDIDIDLHGRNTILNYGGNLSIDRMMMGSFGKSERIFMNYGGNLKAKDVNVDIEDSTLPTVCFAESITTYQFQGNNSTFLFEDVDVGGIKSGIPFVVLRSMNNSIDPVGRLDMRRMTLIGGGSDKSAIVDIFSPRWVGELDLDFDPGGAVPFILTRTGAAGHKVTRVGPSAPGPGGAPFRLAAPLAPRPPLPRPPGRPLPAVGGPFRRAG